MTVHRQAGGYVVDANARKQGIGMLVPGVGFIILGAVWTLSTVLALIAVAAGVYLTVFGIVMRRVPTSDATVTVGEDAVDVKLADGTVRIPWEDVDHWGMARRWHFRTNHLVLWPVAEPAADTVQAARRLWNRWCHGWEFCFDDPDPKLVEELTETAPRPRYDGAARTDA